MTNKQCNDGIEALDSAIDFYGSRLGLSDVTRVGLINLRDTLYKEKYRAVRRSHNAKKKKNAS